MKDLRAVVLTLVAALVLAPAAWSQATNATLSGTVSDESGARIPGADILVVNDATGVDTTTFTNNSGAYTTT
jgi:hypothetical protein